MALLKKAPSESAVQIQGPLASSLVSRQQLTDDQKQLVESTLKVLLAPYRKEDVDEVMAILKSSGGWTNYTWLSIKTKTWTMTKSGTCGE